MLTVEQGIFGGVPVAGNEGCAGFNYQAMVDQPYMFDFYDGGGLDVASLSFAEVDAQGNVNVHAFEGRVRGPGGFPNISARTPKVNFVGTLTAHGLKIQIEDERDEKKLTFQVAPGDRRYVRAAVGFGVIVWRVYPELVDEAEA